jgi:hypothetical protein
MHNIEYFIEGVRYQSIQIQMHGNMVGCQCPRSEFNKFDIAATAVIENIILQNRVRGLHDKIAMDLIFLR